MEVEFGGSIHSMLREERALALDIAPGSSWLSPYRGPAGSGQDAQKLARFFYKGPSSNYFQVCGPCRLSKLLSWAGVAQRQLQEVYKWGLPWWLSGKEFTCQCRRHGFDLKSRKIPHTTEQVNLCTTTTEVPAPRVHTPPKEKPPQEACIPQGRVAPACHN